VSSTSKPNAARLKGIEGEDFIQGRSMEVTPVVSKGYKGCKGIEPFHNEGWEEGENITLLTSVREGECNNGGNLCAPGREREGRPPLFPLEREWNHLIGVCPREEKRAPPLTRGGHKGKEIMSKEERGSPFNSILGNLHNTSSRRLNSGSTRPWDLDDGIKPTRERIRGAIDPYYP
jgi:hypothetical protein